MAHTLLKKHHRPYVIGKKYIDSVCNVYVTYFIEILSRGVCNLCVQRFVTDVHDTFIGSFT